VKRSEKEHMMVALQERNLSSPGADMYKGHKVVAMPSSTGEAAPAPAPTVLSVRDVVTNRGAFDPNRPRSLSAGRATTRSRDIVQEVYDRMGVNRGGEAFDEAPHNNNEKGSDPRGGRAATPGRGREPHSPDTAEKFSQRYRAAAALSSPAHGSERGRNAEQETPRRSRSLSRGRAVAGRWPPAQPGEQQAAPQPVASFMPRKLEEPPVTNRPPSPQPAAAAAGAAARNRTFSRSESLEDTKADSDSTSKESEEKGASSSVPSIKDRISAYAGRGSARKFAQKKPANYQTYASRERPAPIDIYKEVRKKDVIQQEEPPADAAMVPEPSAVPPSPAAAAAADAAFAFVRNGSSARSVKSAGNSRTPKTSTGIAGTYLGAIKSPVSTSNKPVVTQTTSAPLTEISASDPGGDGHSVAASSVSGDEFNFTSPATHSRSVGGASSSAKKPSWAERSRPQVSSSGRNSNGAQYNSNGGQFTPNGNKSSSPSASEIEKIVEQRVQARVSVIEMRMEEQMQRLERRMEEKLKSRIGMIDEKIDKMNSMLAMLLSRELGGGRSEHREI